MARPEGEKGIMRFSQGGRAWSSKHRGGWLLEARMLGKGLGVLALGVKCPDESTYGVHYLGVFPGGIIPGSGLATLVAKPLERGTRPG
jgi:hypothetical protein